jgi:hypothetical protein
MFGGLFFFSNVQADVSVRIFILIYFKFICTMPSKSSLQAQLNGRHETLNDIASQMNLDLQSHIIRN